MNLRDAVVLELPRPAWAEGKSDGELVKRALAGERIALQLLYRRHVASVTERVTRLLARTGEAEDVVQDAFVAAFADLDQLSDPARFGAWLMRIAVHHAGGLGRAARLRPAPVRRRSAIELPGAGAESLSPAGTRASGRTRGRHAPSAAAGQL
jgi:RNA polymerase sigma-70 factor (ECF subfamily)